MPKIEKNTITEHLDELRYRLIVCLAAIVLTTVFCFVYAENILAVLIRPVGGLVFIAPTEVFFSYLRLAVTGGVFVSMPVILFQAWRFISAGLKNNEKKYALIFGPLSLLLFAVGVYFAYAIVLPLGLNFFLNFAPQGIKPMISVANYIAFVSMMLLAFGLVFEVPIVILFLTKVGLVTPEFLSKNRKYVILLVFVVAAVFTPPDVITQVLLALPLLLLFEFSLLLSRFIRVKK